MGRWMNSTGPLPGRLAGPTRAQVVPEPPEQLTVGRVDHRAGPGRRVERMVDDNHQGTAGAGDPGGLGEEAFRVVEVLQRQDGVGTVHRLVADAGQVRQPVEKDRVSAAAIPARWMLESTPMALAPRAATRSWIRPSPHPRSSRTSPCTGPSTSRKRGATSSR